MASRRFLTIPLQEGIATPFLSLTIIPSFLLLPTIKSDVLTRMLNKKIVSSWCLSWKKKELHKTRNFMCGVYTQYGVQY
ncbi:hypothetical protein Y1Q_0019539 [Alligator mississippiensis]|uniref:Uncharacterized protein n=1 Tax=Alligator mississippiensis TaxID=8496 RepID=A0A151NMN8_ALLMI|nr:hypothetical protein Y1Q_0019539 [Alligator mississippiensis]